MTSLDTVRERPASLVDRTFLVTGGAGATGLATVRELHRRGATVVIGTRSRERYGAAAASLGGERVLPLIADVTDPDGVQREFDGLRRRGCQVTDVVHSAAGGLEPILRQLIRRLMSLRRRPEAELEPALTAFRADAEALVAGCRAFAMQVNLAGPSALLERVAGLLPRGGSIVYYTSLWSSLYGSLEVPSFYDAIAASKHEFETWLAARAPEWTGRGLTVAVVSGHIIKDTPLGEVIDRYMVPLLPAVRQDEARSFFITTADMVEAAVRVAGEARSNPQGRFVRIFVPGPGQATGHLDRSAPALSDSFPL